MNNMSELYNEDLRDTINREDVLLDEDLLKNSEPMA